MVTQDNLKILSTTARALVAPRKGILAADESSSTIEKRLAKIQVPSTEDNRRAYRELLFTTKGAGEFISGVILYDETIRQQSSNGVPFPTLLASVGIMPGIKVDKGAKQLANAPEEKVTEGLDGLRERLLEYRELGARFTKWRAVITIGDTIPTAYCIDVNNHALARFAALSQEAGLVPMVEPEVLMEGNHGIKRCTEVTSQTLASLFEHLQKQGISLEGTILKTNMVLSGDTSPAQATPAEVAAATIETLRKVVPSALPGIAFLSGGQSEQLATRHLNEMNKTKDLPWQLSFSYGRALQDSALKAWRGLTENIPAAQKAYYTRAKLNSLARSGSYKEDMEIVA